MQRDLAVAAQVAVLLSVLQAHGTALPLTGRQTLCQMGLQMHLDGAMQGTALALLPLHLAYTGVRSEPPVNSLNVHQSKPPVNSLFWHQSFNG